MQNILQFQKQENSKRDTTVIIMDNNGNTQFENKKTPQAQSLCLITDIVAQNWSPEKYKGCTDEQWQKIVNHAFLDKFKKFIQFKIDLAIKSVYENETLDQQKNCYNDYVLSIIQLRKQFLTDETLQNMIPCNSNSIAQELIINHFATDFIKKIVTSFSQKHGKQSPVRRSKEQVEANKTWQNQEGNSSQQKNSAKNVKRLLKKLALLKNRNKGLSLSHFS